jgi:hypothetical protein
VSRVVHLNLDEGVVVIRCMSENVGVSAIERLSSGGVRLVCNKQRRCGPDAPKAQGLCDRRSSDARKASAATNPLEEFAWTSKLAFMTQARVQFRKALLEEGDIFRIGRLQLPQILLVDVSHLAGLNGFEKFNEPVPFLVPVFRTHNDAPPVTGNTRSEVS